MSLHDFGKVKGFQIKTATKLYEGIHDKLNKSSLVTIMAASNIFGRGFSDKKIELIMNEYPSVLISSESKDVKIQTICKIKGMSFKTAELFVSNISNFLTFLTYIHQESKLNTHSHSHSHSHNQIHVADPEFLIDKNHPLYNKNIVITGFRDITIQNFLKSRGAKLLNSVSKNTYLVIVKNINEDTVKVSDAKKYGIHIITKDEFYNDFMDG